jgi:hypothetical protein
LGLDVLADIADQAVTRLVMWTPARMAAVDRPP